MATLAAMTALSTTLSIAQEASTFGLPLGFSAEKMDRTADPRKDFSRYASGRWFEAAKIPGDTVRISPIDQMTRRVEVQVRVILDEAFRTSSSAARGSPRQQVGDHYASGMDVQRITELGVSPLAPEFARIDAIDSPKSLAVELARLNLGFNDVVLAGVGVSTDPSDRTRYAVYAAESGLTVPSNDVYLAPAMAPVRLGLLKFITDAFVLAGVPSDAAATQAKKIVEIETAVAAKKLAPVDMADPAKALKRMSYEDLKLLAPAVDWDAYMAELGVALPTEVVVANREALRERSRLLAEQPLADTKVYLRWELLRRAMPYLPPAFIEANYAFLRVMYGNLETPPREKLIAAELTSRLGQPLSQLYVEKHFGPQTRKAAEDLVARVRSQFRMRLVANQWLTPETRKVAIEKLDRASIKVGYPDIWIDHSKVQIRRDDYLGNALRVNEFRARRDNARLGKPVVEDRFADARATLPISVNAAYDPSRNGIDIPAAFLQPPMYDPQADAAVNYCALGAVIGHEITHGFDSQGRLYDAAGNVRDWWAPADVKHFNAQAGKLVAQANAFEVLPGLHANGALAVGENLADVGGVSLAYAALKAHLRVSPKENVKIDGLSQDQRCFIAWAQGWAEKSNEGWLRQVTATDPHPPGKYRASAPSKHEAAFYKAFGIRKGDPMWLDPKDRAAIW
jgi:predicted metalloendopeptidase